MSGIDLFKFMNITHEQYNDFEELVKTISYENLAIVCDFDQTLTSDISVITHQSFPEDTLITSSKKSLLSEQAVLNSAFSERYESTDPSDRAELFQEWWGLSHDLILKSTFKEQYLELCANRLQYRKGAEEFLKFCENNNVKLVIFSAGIANIIKQSLISILGTSNPKNVLVIGNEMKFLPDGSLHSFPATIHSINKTYSSFQHEIDAFLVNCSACLVIGDCFYDTKMMNNFSCPVLNISIIDDEAKRNRQFFDLILDQPSFNPLVTWMKRLLGDNF